MVSLTMASWRMRTLVRLREQLHFTRSAPFRSAVQSMKKFEFEFPDISGDEWNSINLPGRYITDLFEFLASRFQDFR